MLSRKSILVFVLIDFATASPAGTSDINAGYGPLLPNPFAGSPKSIGIFDSSYAERETRSVSLKYAQAGNYLSGIGLNFDAIRVIELADHYYSKFGVSGSSAEPSTPSPPPPPSSSNMDTELPTGGRGPGTGIVGNDAHGDPSGTNADIQLPLRDEVSGALDVLYYAPFTSELHLKRSPSTLIPARQISGCRQIVGSAVVASLKGLIVRPIARPTRISPLHT
ncbi:hypothetical protein BC826DRAFT_1110044 [Russula brevipes]|nr:hypothetical protein BC826DRAFT_1110044 [Russula brevipes]